MGNEVLARLIAQAEAEGAALVTLCALAEEASERGAERAIARIGLDDAAAGRDVGELRELLAAWRDAKASARNALLGWIVRAALAALLLGLALRLGFFERMGG